MGEVYRARDEKLNRDVAIKVLPSDLSENAERLHRFEQEAQAAGALNHPNILAVYDVGVHERAPYVVSELLEGETLRELLDERQPATRKSIDYALQLAHGLGAAHEKGIVHRDIKPDNIFITGDERVKILDFGLAKLAQPTAEGVAQTEIATRRVRTDPGTVMGTVGYMSPEQVRGQAVDHRTDIFSFGAVLYEMLSRRRAFHGDSAIETLNAILKEEPAELAASSQNIAPALERVVWHCLEKSAERRFQSATDIAFALESLSGMTSHSSQQTLLTVSAAVSSPRTWTRERFVWVGVCVMLIIAMAALLFVLLTRSQPSSQTVRLALTTSDKATLPARVTVSPDGSRVALLADNAEGKRLLWVRSLDSLSAQPLIGTEGASAPFWSPDSHSIGYFANGKLFRVEASGGRSQALCEVTETSGGTWNRDGVILFGGPDGLHRVSAQGGTPVVFTKIDPTEEAHRWPYFLPDGRHFIFLGDAPTTENHHIRAGSLDSPETQVLFNAVTRIAYAPPGFLLYVSQGALVAQPFDPQKLKVMGEPAVVAERIATVGGNHEFDFSVSDNGVLAYQTGSIQSQLVWFDRLGKKLQTVGDADTYASVALSADGLRAAVGMLDPDGRHSDIWLLDLLRGSKSRLTFDPKSDGAPIWSPDGTHLAFYSNRGASGHANLFVSAVGAAGEEKVLLPSDSDDNPTSWSRDGQNILFTRYGKMRAGVWLMPLSGDRQPKPLFQSPAFEQGFATFSPNGRFIAYTSNESGRWEVYVQSFPPSADKLVVSSAGGAFPLWRDDGKELFYLTEDGRVMSAEIKSGAKIESSVPQQLFQTRIKFADDCPYAINPDGSRFLINVPAETNDTAPMIVVLNWTAGLKRQ